MQRKDFVDWVRGLAVVAMVVWHTADGWLLASARTGQPWACLRFFGGLAAPSFLFLAGVGAALALRPERPARPLLVECARGLEIMLLGYALRLQTWLVDAAAIVHLYQLRAWLPILLGYVALWLAVRGVTEDRAKAGRLALFGLCACAIGFVQVPGLAPGRLPRLLQIDVLQAIGASLALLTVGERKLKLLQRPGLALAIAAAVACATDVVGAALPGLLPVPIAAYLGKFPTPAGHPVPALFPLFPWAAYAFAGASLGTWMRVRREQLDRVVVMAGLGGALLALLTSETHHAVQATIASSPWTVQPLRVAFRIGMVLVLLWLGWLWAVRGRGQVLISYGRASLRIYWAHLLVAYGLLGHAWQKRLFMGEWAARLALLLALMWLVSRLGTAPTVSPRKAEVSP